MFLEGGCVGSAGVTSIGGRQVYHGYLSAVLDGHLIAAVSDELRRYAAPVPKKKQGTGSVRACEWQAARNAGVHRRRL